MIWSLSSLEDFLLFLWIPIIDSIFYYFWALFCSLFYFLEWFLVFVQLLFCSGMFALLTSSVSFIGCSFAWVTAFWGHSSLNCEFYSPCFSVFSLGVLFHFALFLPVLAGLFILEGNTWSHSNSVEGLAKVPSRAFYEVRFLSYLAGHRNDKLSFCFRINTSCSQRLTQKNDR